MIAGAQAIIGVYQEYPEKDVVKLYDEATALDLIAAANESWTASVSGRRNRGNRASRFGALGFGRLRDVWQLALFLCRQFPITRRPSRKVTGARRGLRDSSTSDSRAGSGVVYRRVSGARVSGASWGISAAAGRKGKAVPALREALFACMKNGQPSLCSSGVFVEPRSELCLEHGFVLGAAASIPPHWLDGPPQKIEPSRRMPVWSCCFPRSTRPSSSKRAAEVVE